MNQYNPEYVERYISHKLFIIVKKTTIKEREVYTSLNIKENKLYKQIFGERSILEAKEFF